MININLLPWRQMEAKKQRNRLRLLLIFSFLLVFIFITGHVYLARLNVISDVEVSDLENKLFSYADKNNSMSLDPDRMNQIKSSQRKIRGLLNFLDCFGKNNMSITHVYFQENQAAMMGRVNTPFVLLKVLELCHINQYGFYIRRMTFSHLKQSDFLQFNLTVFLSMPRFAFYIVFLLILILGAIDFWRETAALSNTHQRIKNLEDSIQRESSSSIKNHVERVSNHEKIMNSFFLIAEQSGLSMQSAMSVKNNDSLSPPLTINVVFRGNFLALSQFIEQISLKGFPIVIRQVELLNQHDQLRLKMKMDLLSFNILPSENKNFTKYKYHEDPFTKTITNLEDRLMSIDEKEILIQLNDGKILITRKK